MLNQIKSSKDKIWQDAADCLLSKLKKTNIRKKRCLLLLSGGSSVNIYSRLAEYIRRSQFNSENLAVGQVDERIRPDKQEEINFEMIKESGIVSVLTGKNIPFYRIPQENSLPESADFYSAQLSKLFNQYDFHMAVLGIGSDGHTAGLLPGYQKMWDKNRFAVGYKNRGQFRHRITITPKAVKLLDYALFVAAGAEKREVLKKIIQNNENDLNLLPGMVIHNIKTADLLTDIQNY